MKYNIRKTQLPFQQNKANQKVLLTSYLTLFCFTDTTSITFHNFQWPWEKCCNTTVQTAIHCPVTQSDTIQGTLCNKKPDNATVPKLNFNHKYHFKHS